MSSRTSVAIEFILANAEQFSTGTYRLNGIELEAIQRLATEHAELLAAGDKLYAALQATIVFMRGQRAFTSLAEALREWETAKEKATGGQP